MKGLGVFRDVQTALVSSLLLAVIFTGWPASFALMGSRLWWLDVAGLLLCAQTMVWAAYLLHDAAHQSLFTRPTLNLAAGEILSFIAGGAYSSFERIRHLHVRHHVDRADITCFDFKRFLARHPLTARTVLALEWAWIPACEILMCLQIAWGPLFRPQERQYRRRALGMLLLRISLLTALAVWSPRAVALYLVAVMIKLHVLNFMDSFQHSYPQYFIAAQERLPVARGSQQYEQQNTFTNPLSDEFRWLNLAVLNFGYHNAHHAHPTVPWFRLPRLHDRLYGRDAPCVLHVGALLRSYHRHRVARVFSEPPPALGAGRAVMEASAGAHGVSFLTVM